MLPSFYLQQKNRRIQQGRINLSILIFSIILITGFIYLWQMNCLVNQDYKLRSFQKDLKALQEENKKLQATMAQMQSLPKLQEATQNLNLLKADNISYLSSPKEKMATNQIIGQP
jgi:uncharacterized membrane protein (DUF106 family)